MGGIIRGNVGDGGDPIAKCLRHTVGRSSNAIEGRTDPIGGGGVSSSADHFRGEADGAVAGGSPDADVVVLTGQVSVVNGGGAGQGGGGGGVPVIAGNGAYRTYRTTYLKTILL